MPLKLFSRTVLLVSVAMGVQACGDLHDLADETPTDDVDSPTLSAKPYLDGGLQYSFRAPDQALYLFVVPAKALPGEPPLVTEARNCVILLERDGPMSSVATSACPKELTHFGHAATISHTPASLAARNAYVPMMLRALKRQPPAPQQRRLWLQACARLASFADLDEPMLAELSRSRNDAAGAEGTQSDGDASSFDTDFARHQRHTPQTDTLYSKLAGPLDGVLIKYNAPQQLVLDATHEFQQTLSLYFKKVHKYVAFGPLTDMDHSAVHTVVRYRKRGSHDPWTKYAEADTENHGAGPSSPEMQRYQTCDNLPITSGYFSWMGECPGTWGDDHLCNDDTRLQIYNAYGGWTSPVECRNVYQGMRPTCRKPW